MFLLDTNVISEIAKPQPNAGVISWIESHQAEIFFSAITIAELHSGIALLDIGRKKSFLEQWLMDLRHEFRDSILSFDEAVAITWGNLDASLKRAGRKIPIQDSYIAAIALHHQMTLVTRNEKDFTGAGVATMNPWK